MTLAHGPWWSEWHHFLPLAPIGLVWLALALNLRRKSK